MLAVAHRGYSAVYPENSALAFEKAIEVGADYIETDLRFSRDGEIVCCHDDNFERIAGRREKVADLSVADIQSIQCHDGIEVMVLSTILAIAHGRVRVMLDVKISTEDMADRALETVQSSGIEGQVIYGARAPEIARYVKAKCPGIAVLAMPGKNDKFQYFLNTPIDAFRLYEDALQPEVVSAIEAAGLPLWVTGGRRPDGEQAGTMTPARLEQLQTLSVSAVLLNDPTLITAGKAKP